MGHCEHGSQGFFHLPTITHKICETNSGEIVWNSAQREIAQTVKFMWNSAQREMKFRHFFDIPQSPKVLSLKSFGSSWGNSYIPCL